MKKQPISKRRLILYLLMTLMLATMIGGVFFMRLKLAQIADDTEFSPNEYKKHYVMICGEGEDEFWDSVYEGAFEQGEDSDIYVERLGENLTAKYDKLDLLKIAIDASVDGIILEGEESAEMVQAISEAREKNIPVVTVKEDCSSAERISFVGISGYNIGKTYGEKLIESLDGNLKTVYVLMDADRADLGQAISVSGIQDAVRDRMGDEYPLYVEGVLIDNSRAFSSEEAIRDIFLNEELPDVMICLSSVFTKCAFQAAVDYNKVGKLSILGYYNSDVILDAVAKNILQSTISIDTEEMGRKSVQALEEYQSTGYVSDYIAVDTKMINQMEAAEMLSEKDEVQ